MAQLTNGIMKKREDDKGSQAEADDYDPVFFYKSKFYFF